MRADKKVLRSLCSVSGGGTARLQREKYASVKQRRRSVIISRLTAAGRERWEKPKTDKQSLQIFVSFVFLCTHLSPCLCLHAYPVASYWTIAAWSHRYYETIVSIHSLTFSEDKAVSWSGPLLCYLIINEADIRNLLKVLNLYYRAFHCKEEREQVKNQQSGKINEWTGLKCMITEFFPLFRKTILQHLTMSRTLSGRVIVTGGTGSLVFINHVTADSSHELWSVYGYTLCSD